jgi:hypothetical protein
MQESSVAWTKEKREFVGVAVMHDGRRVPVRFSDHVRPDTPGVFLRDLLIGLLALISGSRQEPGGRG